MFSRRFWKLTAERAVKVFAESLVAVLVAAGTGLLSTDWTTALSTAGMAALLAVLTSVASSGIGPKGSPSVLQPESPTAPGAAPAQAEPAPVPAAA